MMDRKSSVRDTGRMAVHTHFTEFELHTFMREYDLGAVQSCNGIAEGVENSNFLIHAASGKYILTLYEKRVNPQDLPFFFGLLQHLHENGLNCPLPLRRRDGSALGKLANRPAALLRFLDGRSQQTPTNLHCYEVGAALAHMHIAGLSFPQRRPNSLSIAGWPPLWKAVRAHANDISDNLQTEVEMDLSFLRACWPTNLPEGAIHADLFVDNVLFMGNRVSGIIDFYFACTDFLAYDIAICLNAWCFESDNIYNRSKGQALLAGYTAIRPLLHEEGQALPILARGAAIRFLLTRLYDWINVAASGLIVKKDPLEYSRKLRFHRHVKSSAEYGLAEQAVS